MPSWPLTDRRALAALVVGVVAVAGGVTYLVTSHDETTTAVTVAPTPNVSTTVTPSVTATPTATASPSTTGTPSGSGSATSSPAKTSRPSGAATTSAGGGTKTGASSSASSGSTGAVNLASWPGAATTGVASGKKLETINGNLVVTTAGKVIDGVDVLGSITVKADGVTIRNAKVRCVDVTDFCVAMVGKQGKLENADIGGGRDGSGVTSAIGVYSGGDPGFSPTNTQISKIDVHHTSDGLRVDGYTVVADSWIHDLSYENGAHSDGTTTSAGRNVVYRHNRFESGTNCNIFLQQAGGEPIGNVTIDSNLLVGQTRSGQETSFGICTDRDISSISVHANVFTRGSWQVGPATEGQNWSLWSANRWTDGSLLAKP